MEIRTDDKNNSRHNLGEGTIVILKYKTQPVTVKMMLFSTITGYMCIGLDTHIRTLVAKKQLLDAEYDIHLESVGSFYNEITMLEAINILAKYMGAIVQRIIPSENVVVSEK